MDDNKGFGKVILFNEHFVVYGIPAIVSAIDRATTAKLEPWDGSAECEGHADFIPGVCLKDDRPATPGYKKDKWNDQVDSFKYVFESGGIDPTEKPVRVLMAGDLKAASGIGASAASCCALARAISEFYGLDFDEDMINRMAYEGEKGYHGNPSGIDNTASTFGGLIWFQRGDEGTMDILRLPEKVEVVMGNTGRVADTKAAVAGVAERHKQYPEKYDDLFARAAVMASEAREAIKSGDLEMIGDLMNRNHELLQQIEVSADDLDLLVDIARENGAIGAKMTGGGLGGNMVALTPGAELQEKVAQAIEEAGYEALRTRIG